MQIATIGFTSTSAESFFERIAGTKLPTVVDVRLSNTSQLAGFAKRDDLAYFLAKICGVEYVEEKRLATPHELLDDWRKKRIGWDDYAKRYRKTIAGRDVAKVLDRKLFERGVILLCSEATAEHCHRRLAAEYLAEHWKGVEIRHL